MAGSLRVSLQQEQAPPGDAAAPSFPVQPAGAAGGPSTAQLLRGGQATSWKKPGCHSPGRLPAGTFS